MDNREAYKRATEVFGKAGCIRELGTGLYMRDTGEPACGVGFTLGSVPHIQGKGVTWEDAFEVLEKRRPIWEAKYGTDWPQTRTRWGFTLLDPCGCERPRP
jgi:hypothetical protein